MVPVSLELRNARIARRPGAARRPAPSVRPRLAAARQDRDPALPERDARVGRSARAAHRGRRRAAGLRPRWSPTRCAAAARYTTPLLMTLASENALRATCPSASSAARSPPRASSPSEVTEAIGDGVLLHPPFSRVAPRHGRTVGRPWMLAPTALFNLLGLPVTEVPLGLERSRPAARRPGRRRARPRPRRDRGRARARARAAGSRRLRSRTGGRASQRSPGYWTVSVALHAHGRCGCRSRSRSRRCRASGRRVSSPLSPGERSSVTSSTPLPSISRLCMVVPSFLTSSVTVAGLRRRVGTGRACTRSRRWRRRSRLRRCRPPTLVVDVSV